MHTSLTNFAANVITQVDSGRRGEHHLRLMTKKKGVSLKYGRSIVRLCKTKPQKEENTRSLPPSVRVRVCFFIPQGAGSVRYPSHNSCIFFQYSCSVPLWQPKTLQNSQSCFDDVKPYFGRRPGLSIAR